MVVPKCVGGIGKLFNNAMLGKQAWGLHDNPDSLCGRALKGRYFPNGIFYQLIVLRVHQKHGRRLYVKEMLLGKALSEGLVMFLVPPPGMINGYQICWHINLWVVDVVMLTLRCWLMI